MDSIIISPESKNSYMKKVFYILLVALTILTTGANGQSNKIKNNNIMKRQVLIDKFFIPENSTDEFLPRMSNNRSFIKKLPGFIKDEVYKQTDEEGNLTIITIAIWKDQESIDNAKSAVQAEYKSTGFNPAVFYQRLNIKMERGTYTDLED